MTLHLNKAGVSVLVPGQQQALDWIRSGRKKLLIGGNWVDSVSGKTFWTEDPSTEQPLTQVEEADSPDIDKAVAAARSAFEAPSWWAISPHERARYLLRIADAVELHGDELAAIETYDNGVPYLPSKTLIPHIAEAFRYYAGWVSMIYGTTNPTYSSRFIYKLREPMGVCALTHAWNVPLGMAATKIALALACGNTVVLKPAAQAPLSKLRLAELIQACGPAAGGSEYRSEARAKRRRCHFGPHVHRQDRLHRLYPRRQAGPAGLRWQHEKGVAGVRRNNQSGFGREFGAESIESHTQTKSVLMKL